MARERPAGERPLRNRVTPLGDIVATPHRGTMMGNRGIIHDPRTRRLLTRRWQHQAWICCVLEYRGFVHPIMGVGRYTELFFLDEATALAAGHRPCALCRRPDFVRFKAAWVEANLRGTDPRSVRAHEIDRRLHTERTTRRREKVTHRARLETLPDGVFVVDGEQAMLVLGRWLLPWQAGGYAERQRRGRGDAVVLTPRSIVAALRAGYRPQALPDPAP